MIVKNESKIICRLLTSVLPLIDSYCICDTGSNDCTPNIIQEFFKEAGIPGKIIYEPFKDFGYNRSFALKECVHMDNSDYILLLDADMVLKINENFSIINFKNELTADAYYLFQGSNSFYYKNVRLIKNKPDIKYWGVTHEYIKLLENSTYLQIEKEDIFIEDIGDGGSKSEKFIRDIELLKKGLEEHPNNDRYLFYLANSYRDSKQYSNAIITYKKRILLGGWNEEVWDSYYNIGKCYYKIGDYANAIYYWVESHNFFSDRIENLYEIIKHYREKKANNIAYSFYVLANEIRSKKTKYDNLFLQKDIYDYKLDYELSIIGYYCNWEKYDIPKISMKVMACSTVTDEIIKSTLNNYKFYTGSLSIQPNSSESIADKEMNPNLHQFITALYNIGENIDRSIFYSSTPSLCYYNNQIIVNVRFVNYKINENGGYINKDKIISINVIATFDITVKPWKKIKEEILNYDNTLDDIYIGLEDIRLFEFQGKLLYNCNRPISMNQFMVEHGTIHNNEIIYSNLLKINIQKPIEKNWVLFHNNTNQLKCIHSWYPITICDIIDNQCIINKQLETPTFFKYVRGSTNGIIIGHEIWFLCHLVSYESRRYYYHLFIILDINTLTMKKYTKLFTFEKSPVEYTLGFIYLINTNEFLISYSIMDCQTKYMTIGKDKVEELFLHNIF
jgi:tetratricopeptide (TPR) repeat protein